MTIFWTIRIMEGRTAADWRVVKARQKVEWANTGVSRISKNSINRVKSIAASIKKRKIKMDCRVILLLTLSRLTHTSNQAQVSLTKPTRTLNSSNRNFNGTSYLPFQKTKKPKGLSLIVCNLRNSSQSNLSTTSISGISWISSTTLLQKTWCISKSRISATSMSNHFTNTTRNSSTMAISHNSSH